MLSADRNLPLTQLPGYGQALPHLNACGTTIHKEMASANSHLTSQKAM